MRKELLVLLISSEFILFAGGLFGPIYAVYVQGIGGDMLAAGEAYAVFCIVAALLFLVISSWEDHVKHLEKMITIGYLVSAIGFTGYLFVTNPMELFLVQAVLGMAEAIWVPAYCGLYSSDLDKGKYASEWGLGGAVDRVVLGVSAVAGGYIATVYGFKALFILMALLALFGAIAAMILLRMDKKDEMLRMTRKKAEGMEGAWRARE